MVSRASSEAPTWHAPSAAVPFRPAVRPALISVGTLSGGCCSLQGNTTGFFPHGTVRHVSTFLHPFAPPELPGFIATMSALTPARRRGFLARSAPRREGGTLMPFFLLRRAGLLASRLPSLRNLPSPTTPLPPMTALSPNRSASWASCVYTQLTGLGFAFRSQARQTAWPNRVCLRYGRLRRLPLLPTPPHGDAVTFGYRPVGLPEEDLHLPGQNALASARSPGQAGR